MKGFKETFIVVNKDWKEFQVALKRGWGRQQRGVRKFHIVIVNDRQELIFNFSSTTVGGGLRGKVDFS